jgi:3-oxoacyl-[acyl-carrier protein] reductase
MGILEGKVALVTGAARGIGAGIARRLAREGAAVAFTYPNENDNGDATLNAIENAGGRAWAIEADSADPVAVEAAVERTVEYGGKIDILVNNAGIIIVKNIRECGLDDFEKMLAINVRGAFVASQAATRHLKSGGRIINIGSCNADRMPFEGGSLYSLTKAAMAGFTRGLARDLGPSGITVNNIQPGPTNTDLNPVDGPYAATFRAMLAVDRFADVDEIAGMVVYLAGPDAGFVTGTSLTIDGGFNT